MQARPTIWLLREAFDDLSAVFEGESLKSNSRPISLIPITVIRHHPAPLESGMTIQASMLPGPSGATY
jgi:hypothetical protein